MVAPGSHKLESVIDRDAHIWDVTAPDREKMAEFVDPDLKAGDVLLMNGHTWHLPPAGSTEQDRVGFFNKYCAVNAPPAAGYYPYSPASRDVLSDEGKRLIPVAFDKPIATTELLIEDTSEATHFFEHVELAHEIVEVKSILTHLFFDTRTIFFFKVGKTKKKEEGNG